MVPQQKRKLPRRLKVEARVATLDNASEGGGGGKVEARAATLDNASEGGRMAKGAN